MDFKNMNLCKVSDFFPAAGSQVRVWIYAVSPHVDFIPPHLHRLLPGAVPPGNVLSNRHPDRCQKSECIQLKLPEVSARSIIDMNYPTEPGCFMNFPINIHRDR